MSEVATPDVLEEVRGGIGWVRINRPDRRNALQSGTVKEIGEAFARMTSNPEVRAIILTGEGNHFAAGADVNTVGRLGETSAAKVRFQVYGSAVATVRTIYDCPKPTIAAVKGVALTLGCELALACDFRVVSPSARFHEAWVRAGLLPPLGGLFLLPRIVGLGRAASICLRGAPVGGEEACTIGLAHELASEEGLFDKAEALAQELGRLPPLSYAAIKEGLHRGLESTMQNEWSANVSAQSILLGTDDFKEGLAAIREKRQANFSGS